MAVKVSKMLITGVKAQQERSGFALPCLLQHGRSFQERGWGLSRQLGQREKTRATAILSQRFHRAVEMRFFTGTRHAGPPPGEDPVLGKPTARHQLRFLKSSFLLHRSSLENLCNKFVSLQVC